MDTYTSTLAWTAQHSTAQHFTSVKSTHLSCNGTAQHIWRVQQLPPRPLRHAAARSTCLNQRHLLFRPCWQLQRRRDARSVVMLLACVLAARCMSRCRSCEAAGCCCFPPCNTDEVQPHDEDEAGRVKQHRLVLQGACARRTVHVRCAGALGLHACITVCGTCVQDLQRSGVLVPGSMAMHRVCRRLGPGEMLQCVPSCKRHLIQGAWLRVSHRLCSCIASRTATRCTMIATVRITVVEQYCDCDQGPRQQA
jgi:hypothetical protein